MHANKYSTASGFSLIELLVAVGIVAILAGIAIPAYQSYIRSGNITECSNEIALLKLAEEEFFVENNSYFLATSISALETQSNGLYRSAFQGSTALANRNCTFAVAVGTTTNIATSYAITATGTNKLDSSEVLTQGN